MDTSPTLPEKQSSGRWSYLFLGIGCVLLIIAFLVGISDNPPGIVSMLLGGFLVILGIFYRFAKSGKRTFGQELLYWAPRALCITCALFIGMFALDAFAEGRSFWENILALFMHLIPTFVILIVLALSWQREWIGGLIFVLLAVLYIWSIWNTRFFWTAGPLISGPLLLTGILFLLNWHYRADLRGNRAGSARDATVN